MIEYILLVIIMILIIFCVMEGVITFIVGLKSIKRNRKKKTFINKEAHSIDKKNFERKKDE